MEAYRHNSESHTRTSHLTKLYSDVKKSADFINPSENVSTSQPSNISSALQRKYRIQRDRLLTWGLAWNDNKKGLDGDIDDAVARAGLTETIDSVLRNIGEVTREAEQMKSGTVLKPDSDSKIAVVVQPAGFDEARYEDLLRDLTASIDTLYDLSRSRLALARGEHPTFTASASPTPAERAPATPRAPVHKTPSFSSSVSTLVNPASFSRPALSPYAGLPPRIDTSALRLPFEGPPPYESLGVPPNTRLVGQLIPSKVSEVVRGALGSTAAEVPVLIDYANFDSIYRETHVPPPLQRLEALAAYFQPMRAESQTNLSLLGYFEDATQPRIGLVYDIPYVIQNRLQGNAQRPAEPFTSVSLLKLVQKSAKTQGSTSSSEIAAPALESRYRLALRLTEQLANLHSREMYHGNINSSSVLLTMTSGGAQLRPETVRAPLWASFDLFSRSTVEGLTRNANLNVYRHPDDNPQSLNRDLLADIRFDMYGLALILLEIGLWIPIGDFYKPKYSVADFKYRLEKLYIPKLAAKCGTVYMRVVEACIRIADDIDGSDWTTNGVYAPLLEKLRMCALLDEDTDPEAAFSESSELSRITSSSTIASSLPRRFASLTEVASSPDTLSFSNSSPLPQRGASSSMRSQASQKVNRSDPQGGMSRHPKATPSFREYKRKIILIQHKWREYRARCLEEIWSRNAQLNARTNANPEPVWETDIVPQKPKRKEFPQVQLPQVLMDEWQNKTAHQLANLVEKALNGSIESSSISLTAYGETPETARPTLLVCCKSTAKVKQMLKRHFKYDPTKFDVRVKKEEIRRCHKSRRTRGGSDSRRSMAPWSGLDKAKNPDYQERPLCGASIGAYRDDEHLPPVSFGGVVVVDGLPYGMSVHHMLEAESDDEVDAEGGAEDDDESDTSSIGSADDASLFSHSDDEDTVRPPSTVPDSEIFTSSHDGDMPGLTPDDYEEIAVTQPALDDAIEMDLHVDETDDDDSDEDSGVDEDHLLSYKLGQVHATSGLKRSAQSTQEGFKSISQSLPQEIDWALFELVPPRVHAFNIVKGGSKYCPTSANRGPDSYPVAIRASTELACTKVHCLGRTSGLETGVISSTMELVKIHGRSTFSASWTVDGGFGVGGDSGAWVISNDDGRVCGHVLASRRGRTYICPMDLLLDDIKQTLGAKVVELPAVPPGKGSRRQTRRLAAETEMGRSMIEEAVGKMRIGEHEGGVPVPASPVRRSMHRGRGRARHRDFFESAGTAVQTAG